MQATSRQGDLVKATLSEGYVIAGRFTLDCLIYKSRNACVYQARDLGGKSFAIKIDDEDAGPLFSEFHVLIRINNATCGRTPPLSRVISIHGFGRMMTEHLRWIAVPFQKDRDLAAKIDHRNLNAYGEEGAQCLITICIAMLKALEQVHRAGYSHGDVKPANILIDHEQCLILADFETASRLPVTDNQEVKVYEYYNGDDDDGDSRADDVPGAIMYGSITYCSIDAHGTLVLGPRSDLQNLTLMAEGILNGVGSLPWVEVGDPAEIKRMKLAYFCRDAGYDASIGSKAVRLLATSANRLTSTLQPLPYGDLIRDLQTLIHKDNVTDQVWWPKAWA